MQERCLQTRKTSKKSKITQATPIKSTLEPRLSLENSKAPTTLDLAGDLNTSTAFNTYMMQSSWSLTMWIYYEYSSGFQTAFAFLSQTTLTMPISRRKVVSQYLSNLWIKVTSTSSPHFLLDFEVLQLVLFASDANFRG